MTDIEIPVGKRTRAYRFFERLPLVLTVSLLLSPVVLSLIDPLYGAVFVIVYIAFWLVRALVSALQTVQGYRAMKLAEKVNWRDRMDDLEHPQKSLDAHRAGTSWHARVHLDNLRQLTMTENPLKPSEVTNIVIIAVYNESREVVEPTLKSLLKSDYDLKKLIVVIAYEERGGPEVAATMNALRDEYKSQFGDFLTFEHPKDMKDEVIGKGGNITYAGRQMEKWCHERSINPENVLITTIDSDNKPAKGYFSYATYEFVVHPDRRHASLQPLAIYTSNIWDVPAAMRVLAVGNSLFNIVVSRRPHLLRNFAAHSQSMAGLIDTDFWSTRTIVEDGHQFWRSYFRFDGHYEVVPIYLPIYQDAVLSETYRRTLVAQFIQLRRWTYGASDIAYVATRFFRRDRSVPFVDGFSKLMRLIDSHVSWASASIILFFGAWIPLLISQSSQQSIVAHQLPELASLLQRVAMVGLVLSVFLTFKLLPPRPARYKRHRNILMLLQWALMPITALVYGSFASLTSQYLLFRGKYLDKFDVTEKAFKTDD